jgi:hypothetical protein
MELYFLGKYNREQAEGILIKNDFKKEKFTVFGATRFMYVKEGFRINLTSPEEGKIQIQGSALDDIIKKDKMSSFYPEFKAVVDGLMPEKIIDSGFNEYFQEITILKKKLNL